MSSILGTAMSGLYAAQAGLQTASHNLANVNTPGYTRQTVVQGSGIPVFTGSLYIGGGTTVAGVERVYSDHLQAEMRGLSAQAGQSSTHSTELQRLGNLIADGTSNLSGAIDGFFGAAQTLSAHPGESSARQGFLSSAEVLAQRFRSLGDRIDSMRQGIDGRIGDAVKEINALATNIANMNRQIVRDSASGTAVPNDLLDQRDAMIAELNTRVRANVAFQGDGSANIYLSNGHALVVGTTTQPLAVQADGTDASLLRVGAQTGSSMRAFRSGEITGGDLGGLLAFRDESLAPAEAAVGRLAMVIAHEVNARHALGQDLNGNPGADVFSIEAPVVNAATANTGSGTLSTTISDYGALQASAYQVQYDGSSWNVTRLSDHSVRSYAGLPQNVDGLTLDVTGAASAGDNFLVQATRGGAKSMRVLLPGVNQIAAAAPVRASAPGTNLGDASIASLQADSADPNLLAPVTLTFTGTGSFDVSGTGTGNPTGVAYVSGGTISYNGWTLVLQGQPRAGDSFVVSTNTGGNGDNRNALALAGLATAQAVEGATFSGAFAQLVSGLGSQSREVELARQAQSTMLDQAQQAVSSVSGVNLDEEAANLMRYQHAYQAASKVISIFNSMFDSILSISH